MTTKARPLQRVSATEVQQHKQLIKLRWRRQNSCRPCREVRRLPGHCYPLQRRQAETGRLGNENKQRLEMDMREPAARVPRHSPPVGRPVPLDQPSLRPELPRIKENECFKESQLIRKASLCGKLAPSQLSEEALMKIHHSSTQANSVIKQNSGVELISDWWVGHLSTS